MSYVHLPGSAPAVGVTCQVGGAKMEGRIQFDVGGVTELGIAFEDTHTALQQLEVPLQARGAGSDTQVEHVCNLSEQLFV